MTSIVSLAKMSRCMEYSIRIVVKLRLYKVVSLKGSTYKKKFN